MIISQLELGLPVDSTAFQSKLGMAHIIFALFVTEYYTEKLLSSLKNKVTTLSKNYLLSYMPMIPFRLGMTYHRSPDDNLF